MARSLEPARFSMPAAYLRQVAEHVRTSGVDVALWLVRSGLTPETLADTAQDLPLATFQQLILDAMELTREPALGLFVGQRLEVQTHGALGYAASSSGSIASCDETLSPVLITRSGRSPASFATNSRLRRW